MNTNEKTEATDAVTQPTMDEIKIRSVRITRLSHPTEPTTFLFDDCDGVKRKLHDPSGDIQRLVSALERSHVATLTPSGNTRKDAV